MLIHVKSVVLSSGVAKEKPCRRQKPPSNQNEGICSRGFSPSQGPPEPSLARDS
jgi:hypothetical protein